MKIRMLDLFCGAGGAAVGYHRAFTTAGIDVDITGVDICPQKNYPFAMRVGDAMEWPLDGYDFIHASPPCQGFSASTGSYRRQGKVYETTWMLAATRARLQRSGALWIMENVPGAPMRNPAMLCGSMFGLNVIRHRLFDSSHLLFAKGVCKHTGNEISVVGHGAPGWNNKTGKDNSAKARRVAMGIGWMNRNELSQAIPPDYTEWLGAQIAQVLMREKARAA